jgi:hypothetical protein
MLMGLSVVLEVPGFGAPELGGDAGSAQAASWSVRSKVVVRSTRGS